MQLPNWIEFNPENLKVKGRAPNDVEKYSFLLIVNDQINDPQNTTVDIICINSPPIIKNLIKNQTLILGSYLDFNLPSNLISDSHEDILKI